VHGGIEFYANVLALNPNGIGRECRQGRKDKRGQGSSNQDSLHQATLFVSSLVLLRSTA
jgi:hypothetical protein